MDSRQPAGRLARNHRSGPSGAAALSQPIELETALRLCRQVQQETQGRWWRAAWWQCAGCRRFSSGDPNNMCIGAAPGYRGCVLVNHRLKDGPSPAT